MGTNNIDWEKIFQQEKIPLVRPKHRSIDALFFIFFSHKTQEWQRNATDDVCVCVCIMQQHVKSSKFSLIIWYTSFYEPSHSGEAL